MEVTVTGLEVKNWQFGGAVAYLRIYSSGFTASDGTVVPPGSSSAGSFTEVDCTVSGEVVTAPTFPIQTTTDAMDDQTATYTGILFDSSRRQRVVVFSGFSVPTSIESPIPYSLLALHNLAVAPVRDTETYTKTQIDLLLPAANLYVNPASVGALGRLLTSVTPSDPGAPVAVITDDPQYINARDATKIQGRDIASTQATPGQALVYFENGTWGPGTPSERVHPFLFRDEFNESDGTSNTGRRPSYIDNVGTSWRNGAGTWTIEDGKLQPSSPFADGDFQIIDAGTGDVTVTCRVSSDAGSSNPTSSSAQIIIRHEDADNEWLVVMDSRAQLTILYEVTAGVTTERARISTAPATNVEIPLTVSAVGPNFTMGLFGQTPVLYTSSVHQSATKVGVRAGHGGGTPAGVPTFSQFTVSPAFVKAADPIISRGAAGEWDDADVAAPSSPVLDEENDRFVVGYAGFGSVTQKWQQGFAYCPRSADLTDPDNWTKEPTNPKVTPPARMGYIAASAQPVKANGAWHMVMQGAQNATAGDPDLPWEVFGLSSPDMTDGGDWSFLNGGEPIIPLGASGSFDESHHDPRMRFRSDGRFHVVFAARNGAGLFTLGHCEGESLMSLGATSQLPVAPGVTGLLNPAFDGDDPNVYGVLFSYDVSGARQILYAYTDGAGQTFKFLNLILAKSASGWPTVQVFDGALFTYEGVKYLLSAGANATGGTEGMGADIGIASFILPSATPEPLPSDPAPEFVTLPDGATITLDFGNGPILNAQVTLGGNRTLAAEDAESGNAFNLYVTQDATGGRTLTLPAGWKVAGGGSGAVSLTATANAVDLIRGQLVGNVWRVERVLNFT